MTLYQKFIKRTFDLVFSFTGLIILCPIGLLLSILIKLSSNGPVFYKQNRIGRYGKPFICIKFRTMYTGTDKQGSITSATDSRITPIGKFLRKYKIDEFPQLWNVLIGKMSFVGPRPDVPGYADKLSGEDRKILNLRPGITGPASIYFRNEETLLAEVSDPQKYSDQVIWPQKVKLNLEYFSGWGFWKDLGYILITLAPFLDHVFRVIPDSSKR